MCPQFESAADRGRSGKVGAHAVGAGGVHVRRVDGRVLQTVEEHRVVGPRAAPDRRPAVRRVGRTPDPVADAGRREHRARLFPVRAPVGTAPGLEGQGRPGLVRSHSIPEFRAVPLGVYRGPSPDRPGRKLYHFRCIFFSSGDKICVLVFYNDKRIF